jgi:hypothetical protein
VSEAETRLLGRVWPISASQWLHAYYHDIVPSLPTCRRTTRNSSMAFYPRFVTGQVVCAQCVIVRDCGPC